MSNWRAFLALAQHANWNDEFLSAAVEWAKRTIELLLAFHHMNAPGSNATKLQMYICGFWDDPSYHRRGRLNPRVADEIAALRYAVALTTRESAERFSLWSVSFTLSAGAFR